MSWVYFYGERTGVDIKIGWTKGAVPAARLAGVNGAQMNDDSYVFLAGVRGHRGVEKSIQTHFGDHLKDKGRRTEYFKPAPEVYEYVNWLRSQWFVATTGRETEDDLPLEDPGHWSPGLPGRRHERQANESERMFQDFETIPNPLAGTAWAWMVDPLPSHDDYFTPVEIVNAARAAMGDIDLDAASHSNANKKHKIANHFGYGRSAFDHRWFGRVWLNPPYGDNDPWFACIRKFVASGDIEQLCMLSPVWAFTTSIARPVMELSTAFVLLSPTPKFWGNADPTKTGKNHPHGILYIGDAPERFVKAFCPEFGMPLSFRWDLFDGTEDA